ncbi:hypothetical protein Vretifemale_9197, partial [Volvox reticuliferus]
GSGGSGGSGVSGGNSCIQAAFDLYKCEALWPSEMETEPSFAPVLACAGSALVTHFDNAISILNDPVLIKQLLALPAIALELLMQSDDFATDCESSVLLLLTTWMRSNFHCTDEESRKRLCRTVRLAQLSRSYASMIVPVLAADHERSPDQPAGWFPVGLTDALFTASLVSSPEDERLKLLTMAVDQDNVIAASSESAGAVSCDLNSILFLNAFKLNPRPQCIPPSGLDVPWFVTQLDLQAALARLQPGKTTKIACTFQTGGGISSNSSSSSSGCSNGSSVVPDGGAGGCSIFAAGGFHWSLWLKLYSGPRPSAGLFVRCELPPAFKVDGSRLGEPTAVRMVVRYNADLVIRRWRDGVRQDIR